MNYMDDSVISQIRKESMENVQKISMVRKPTRYENSSKGTFILRTAICISLFMGFFLMDKERITIGTYDSSYIRELIKSDISLEIFHDL